MEFFTKNIGWDDILTTLVIWAIPTTLVWFSVKLYKFCRPVFRNAASEGKVGKCVTMPICHHDLSVDPETDEWLAYTTSSTGVPGLPPNNRD